MAKRPAVPGGNKPTQKKHASWKHVFATPRQTFYFAFFIFWLMVDIALLGLVSQQIHAHGHDITDWPTGKYQHAMGLLLFATIFSVIIGLFHSFLNLPILMFVLFANAVFFGTAAGIIYETPFGHGLQCSNSLDIIPENWRPDFHWCRRVTAIEGLSWAMFGLAIIGLFYAFGDKFSLVSKRNSVYDDPEDPPHEKIPESH